MKLFILMNDYGPYEGGAEIMGVFSTKNIAERHAVKFSRRRDVPIVDFPTDPTQHVLYIEERILDEWDEDD